ncbi:MAG: carboxypeptidase-like regulatory domain-containing protein, partial [Tannerellaceae bacterium]
MRILISFLFVLLSFCPAKALAENFALSGRVTNTQNEPLVGTTILLFANDSVFAASVCDNDGLFKINELPVGAFRLQASFVGYTTYMQDVELNKHVALSPIVLQENLQKLDEVTVQGDRKNVVKHEAGSTTFFLSANARKQSISPYEALREIPKLKINVETKLIGTLSGRPTLVTVNGIKRNSAYISTLSAEDIEGAEIIETPDMQYLDGAPELTVVNLIVKPRKDYFTSGSIMPLFSPLFNFNYLSSSFAAGSEKASFYIDATGMAIFDNKDRIYNYTESGNIIKEYNGKPDSKFYNIYVSLGGDWKPTDKDLFLLAGTINTTPAVSKNTTESGTISLKGQTPVYALNQELHSRTDYMDSFFNLLYERTISKDQNLKAEVANGIIRNKSKRSMTSESELMSYDNRNHLKESRLLFNANINYKQKLNQYATMNVGSKTSYRNNDFDDKLDAIPTYNFQNTTEYIYADVAGNVSKLSYKAGLGLDMVFNNAAGVHHQYYNLLGNASLSYSFNKNNWTTLSGSRTRLSPSYTQMNPENTSVDSLII